MIENNFNFNKKDPFKSSPLEQCLNLEKLKEGIPYGYKDSNGNIQKTYFSVFKDNDDYYVEKNPEFKPNQQDLKTEHFISLLIKGVFHSSDIIKKNDKYFSKIIDLENAEKSKYGEIEAEIFLLRYIFSDWDKNFPNNNIRTKNGNFAHYDYSEAFRGVYEKYFKMDNDINDLTNRINIELNNISKYKEPFGLKRKSKTLLSNLGIPLRKKEPEIEEEIYQKSKELLSRIEDKNFWSGIIKKSEFEAKGHRFKFLKSENKIEELRFVLKERLKKIIEIIEKRNLKYIQN